MANVQSKELSFDGLFTSQDESKVPLNHCWRMSNCQVDNGILEGSQRYALWSARSGAHAGDIGWGFGYGRFVGNEQQLLSITGSPTGGTLKIKWRPNSGTGYQTTGNIAYNASATDVYNALIALSNIRVGDVQVTGGPWPEVPILVSFMGQYSSTDLDPIVLDTNALTGGTAPTLTISEFAKGGDIERYLVAVQKNGDSTVTVYAVDMNGTWTQIASGLTASDWHFVQYQRKVYAFNETDGIHFYILGGYWDNGILGSGVRPVPPASQPTITVGNTSDASSHVFANYSSAGNYSGWSVNPTVALEGSILKFTLNATVTNAQVAVDITLSAAQDYSYRDLYHLVFQAQDSTGPNSFYTDASISLINNDGSPITIDAPFPGQDPYATSTVWNKFFQFANLQRDDRDNIIKIRIRMKITGAVTKVFHLDLKAFDNWQNDSGSPNMVNGPVRASIDYAYSYFRISDQTESALSPIQTSPVVPGFGPGASAYTIVAAKGTTYLSSSDKIHFYRREKSTGLWRRISIAANDASGATVSFSDRRMEYELRTLVSTDDITLPGISTGVSRRIACAWKGSLCVGFDRKVWLSYVNSPQQFAPSPDDTSLPKPPIDQLDRGRTDYMSDNRSEDVYCLVGQDSLYASSPYSSYAMVGDSPADATVFRRLPGSRGAISARSAYPINGGAVVASQDGLWYYMVSRYFAGSDSGGLDQQEITKDVRSTYKTLISGGSNVVVCEHNDELWVFNATAYMCRTRNGNWISGTLTDSLKAAFPNRVRGFRWIDSKGRIMTMSPSYTTDNGSAVTWDYETGYLDADRAQIKKLMILGSGTPSCEITVDDGLEDQTTPVDFQRASGGAYVANLWIAPGTRYKLRFHGTVGTDTVQTAIVYFEPAPGAWQN